MSRLERYKEDPLVDFLNKQASNRPKVSPSVLATRYLMTEWQKLQPGENPPMELTEAVVSTVIAVGYTKALVDKLILEYRKNRKP